MKIKINLDGIVNEIEVDPAEVEKFLDKETRDVKNLYELCERSIEFTHITPMGIMTLAHSLVDLAIEVADCPVLTWEVVIDMMNKAHYEELEEGEEDER